MEWMILPYKRYADFNGRSRRMEYWMFTLFSFLMGMFFVALILAGLPWDSINADGSESTTPPQFSPLFFVGIMLYFVFWLGTIVPALAVLVRRFHDQDKSGWMLLLYLVPYAGPIIIFVFMCLDGTKGENRFGPDPKDPDRADIFA
ncbi:MAG: DUF805 domain-containing protein [Sphingomonadaceae bacterium]